MHMTASARDLPGLRTARPPAQNHRSTDRPQLTPHHFRRVAGLTPVQIRERHSPSSLLVVACSGITPDTVVRWALGSGLTAEQVELVAKHTLYLDGVVNVFTRGGFLSTAAERTCNNASTALGCNGHVVVVEHAGCMCYTGHGRVMPVLQRTIPRHFGAKRLTSTVALVR